MIKKMQPESRRKPLEYYSPVTQALLLRLLTIRFLNLLFVYHCKAMHYQTKSVPHLRQSRKDFMLFEWTNL